MRSGNFLKKARSSPSTPLVGFMLKRRNYHNNYKRSWACPTSVFQRSCV
ncbi:hypothetical protein HanLR1_Chr01g0005731 [Helianthus annuus]|nr:hypothetical protein HanLR1_Chr01g0005731 [Helianthus annuus]